MIVLRKRLAGLVAAAAVGVMGVASLSPAPASAAQAGCSLRVNNLDDVPGYYPGEEYVHVIISCTPHSASDVRTKIILWGEDGLTNDDVMLHVSAKSPHQNAFILNENWLDEDLWDRDEVYVTVTFKPATGKPYSLRTNTVKSLWGAPGV